MLAGCNDYSIIAVYMTEIDTVATEPNEAAQELVYEFEERDYAKLKAAGSLAGTAVTAYCLQHFGITKEMPIGMKEISNSGCHPVLGFAGAWLGSAITRGRYKFAGMAAGATAANFFIESAQSRIINHPQYFEYLARGSLLETGKDYAFALGGMALYAILWSKEHPHIDS